MASQDYEIRGYGIQFDSKCGTDTTVDRIKQLLELAPEVKADVEAWLKDIDISLDEVMVDDYADFDQDYNNGIPALIAKVINAVEGIFVEAASDDDGVLYLYLCCCMPWGYNEKERNLTAEELEDIFRKYWNILYPEKVTTIDAVSIHQFG